MIKPDKNLQLTNGEQKTASDGMKYNYRIQSKTIYSYPFQSHLTMKNKQRYLGNVYCEKGMYTKFQLF